MSKKKDKTPLPELERKPWISKNQGRKVMMVLSFGLAIWVAVQIIKTEGDWGKGILWGVVFGVSIWLVYLGMNWFHGLFSKKDKK